MANCSTSVTTTGQQCAVAGMLGRRGGKCTGTQVGGFGHVFVNDVDLCTDDRLVGRRVEVVAGWVPLFGGSQFAPDTVLVTATRGAAVRAAAALTEARRHKEATYLGLVGDRGRARLLVLAAELGACWSDDASQLFRRRPSPGGVGEAATRRRR